MSVRIIVDSACDLTADEAKKLDVEVLPLRTLFGQEEYLDGVTMTQELFYEKLVETDVLPTTSQLSPYDYQSAFEKYEGTGDEILVVTLSSRLSGCYQSANIAASDADIKVCVVDSLNVCVAQRILVEQAVRLRDQGMDAEAIAAQLEKDKENLRIIALLDTLEYLKKGGRISASVAFAGTLLSIKPVVTVHNGEVIMLGKARGSKNGNNMLIEMINKEGGIDFSMPYGLAYSGLSSDMIEKYLADSKSLYEGHIDEMPISRIGSTIGTHVGPGAIAAAFFVNER